MRCYIFFAFFCSFFVTSTLHVNVTVEMSLERFARLFLKVFWRLIRVRKNLVGFLKILPGSIGRFQRILKIKKSKFLFKNTVMCLMLISCDIIEFHVTRQYAFNHCQRRAVRHFPTKTRSTDLIRILRTKFDKNPQLWSTRRFSKNKCS